MAWVPAAIGAGGSILGGMLGNKNAKSAADDAANKQAQLTQQTISQLQNYDNTQRQQQRSAIAGLLGAGNPFFAAAGGMQPQYIAPGQDTAQFGGGGNAPGTFSMPPPAAGPFGGQNPFQGGGRTTMPIVRRAPGNDGGGIPSGGSGVGGNLGGALGGLFGGAPAPPAQPTPHKPQMTLPIAFGGANPFMGMA